MTTRGKIWQTDKQTTYDKATIYLFRTI